MARHTRRKQALTFEVGAPINNMECAVVYRTVTCGFTAMEMVRWLWPSETVDTLRAAYPLADSKSSYVNEYIGAGTPTLSCRIYIDLPSVAMLRPVEGLIRIGGSEAGPLVQVILELKAINARFNEVRSVVMWLNDYATPGAARFYCPWLGALLPREHAFHAGDGLRYKEPAFSMEAITPMMRRAGATVAGGLLADPDNVDVPHTQVGISLSCVLPDDYSQRFMLL